MRLELKEASFLAFNIISERSKSSQCWFGPLVVIQSNLFPKDGSAGYWSKRHGGSYGKCSKACGPARHTIEASRVL